MIADPCARSRERARPASGRDCRDAGVLGAAQVEEGFVDGQRGSTSGGQRPHHLADLGADPRIFPPCSGRMTTAWGQAASGLEHGHGGSARHRASGDIAGGRDDAALAAADDDRLVADGRIVALLDAGIEGGAVDMGDGKLIQLVVNEDPGRAAGRAALGLPVDSRQAIPAKAVQSASSGRQSQAAPRTPLESPYRAGRDLGSRPDPRTHVGIMSAGTRS